MIELPVSQYQRWYRKLNKDYRKRVETEWGKVEKSKIMMKNNRIIIPNVALGNIILLPQPQGDGAMTL